MNYEDLKLKIELVRDVFTIIGFLIGGWWVLFLFNRQRENYPHLEFTIDINFLKEINGWWIVELFGYVENKGKVRHILPGVAFKLKSIEKKDQIKLSEKYNNQVEFPNIILEAKIGDGHGKFFFIEPGVKGKYSYKAMVSKETEILNLRAEFRYGDGKLKHFAEAVKAVPKEENKISENPKPSS